MSRGKRLVDLCGAAAGLVVLWPAFLAIAIAIKIGDGGSVFFRQVRVGRGGRLFRMWKFRTMIAGAEHAGGLLTVGDDPRVTRVGRWLRAHKLDELPQLFNVLAGEMSFVGPRPEVERYVALYTPAQRAVLELVPGITDPASIAYRAESARLARSSDVERTYVDEILPAKIRLDLAYAAHASVWRDLGVIAATVRALLGDGRIAALPESGEGGRETPARPQPAVLRWIEQPLTDWLLRYRRPLILVTHIALIAAAYGIAFALRFDWQVAGDTRRVFWATLPLLLLIRLAAFAWYRLGRGYWRHVGIQDLIDVTKAITTSELVFAVAVAFLGRLGPVPRSVFVLDWMVAILLTGGARFAVRCIREGQIPGRAAVGRRVLIIGAGEAAERFIRLVRHDGRRAEHVIGLVDDDAAKRRTSLHGVPVLGTTAELTEIADRHRAQLLVIAIPSASPEQLRCIVDRCLRAKVEFRQLPPIHTLLGDGQGRGGANGAPDAGGLRRIELEHLLTREPVVLDSSCVSEDIAGRTVLVTGGAGSVGSELARQIAHFRPARLIVLEQAESPLYFLQLELQRAFPELDLVPVIGDITDRARLTRVFATYRPDHVFHAAAYKHVPLMEANVSEAVHNNVVGTLRVAQCAAQFGTRRFVLISTDKAVRPSSIMGATKRVAERIVLGWPALRASRTDFRAVRFGNVLGSDGSVVPLFKRQLAAGGPITVTHPDVRRYFMTVAEAAQLVLHAAVLPEAARCIAMVDMGEQVRIVELAENLVRLSGLVPHRDVEIVFTGLRPGEKLHEELMSDLEVSLPTTIEKIRLVQTDEVDGERVREGVERLIVAASGGERPAVLDALCAMVPECIPPLRGHQPAVTARLGPEMDVRIARAVGV